MFQTAKFSSSFPELPKPDYSGFLKSLGLASTTPKFDFSILAPKEEPKHKVFISYYHKDDQPYKNEFDKLFGHLFINKSVQPGDIKSDLTDDYISQLIMDGYIDDASVVVVLVGAKTYCRKHVDWEISAGLDPRVGSRAGIFGILLPTHPLFSANQYNINNTPYRLVDNLDSGYAKMYKWTDNANSIKSYAEEAFKNRIEKKDLVRNGRKQLTRNLCD